MVRVTYGISAFDDDGVTPTTPTLILSKIPQDVASSAEWSAILQALDTMTEATALLYKGWRSMHRSWNTSWRNMVQMDWQSQEDAQERRINPAHPMLTTFEEKLALSIVRLKDNVPGSVCPAAAQPTGRNQTTTPRKDSEPGERKERERPGRPAPKKSNLDKKHDKPFNRDYPSHRSSHRRIPTSVPIVLAATVIETRIGTAVAMVATTTIALTAAAAVRDCSPTSCAFGHVQVAAFGPSAKDTAFGPVAQVAAYGPGAQSRRLRARRTKSPPAGPAHKDAAAFGPRAANEKRFSNDIQRQPHCSRTARSSHTAHAQQSGHSNGQRTASSQS